VGAFVATPVQQPPAVHGVPAALPTTRSMTAWRPRPVRTTRALCECAKSTMSEMASPSSTMTGYVVPADPTRVIWSMISDLRTARTSWSMFSGIGVGSSMYIGMKNGRRTLNTFTSARVSAASTGASGKAAFSGNPAGRVVEEIRGTARGRRSC